MDVLQVIRQDHSELKAQLDILADTAALEPYQAATVVRSLAESFAAHHEAEEQLLFSRLRDFDDVKELIDEAWEEHAAIDLYLQRIRRSHSSVRWPAKAAILRDMVELHMAREENRVFAAIEDRLEDGLELLGARFEEVKQKRLDSPLLV